MFSVKILLFQGILCHKTPHFVAYFGSIFLLIWRLGVVEIVFVVA